MNLFATIRAVAYDGSHFLIRFDPADEDIKEAVKLVPGIRHDRTHKCWRVPATSEVSSMLRKGFSSFAWTNEAREQAEGAGERELNRLEASKCAEGSIILPGFGKPPYPFQQAGIIYALDAQRVIIGDEMGLGKTIQGLGTVYGAEAIKGVQAFPLLVVTPSSNKYHWAETEIPQCLPFKRVILAEKKTKPLLIQMADIIVTNYEQLTGHREYMTHDKDGNAKKARTCWTDETRKHVVLSPLALALQKRGLKSIILDEAHYIKESDAARSRACKELRLGVPYRLLLTGTPMLNKPSEFVSLLEMLDRLDEFGGWWGFMKRYCGLENGQFGLKETGAYNTFELNTKLRKSCYVRRRKMEVWKDMPSKTRTSYLVDIDNRQEYNKAKTELERWAADNVMRNKQFVASLEGLNDEERANKIAIRRIEKAEAAEKNEAIVRINAFKQVIARGKLKAAKDWIDDFLKSGEKLVAFATHKVVIDALLGWYPDAAKIISEDSARERQTNVQRFQNDPNCSLIIGAMGTSAANSPAGVGHTLTAACNCVFLELGWNPALHNQCEDRCHRLGQERNVSCYYLLGRETFDIDIAEIIEHKRALSAQIVDGVESEIEAGILEQLMERLAG